MTNIKCFFAVSVLLSILLNIPVKSFMLAGTTAVSRHFCRNSLQMLLLKKSERHVHDHNLLELGGGRVRRGGERGFDSGCNQLSRTLAWSRSSTEIGRLRSTLSPNIGTDFTLSSPIQLPSLEPTGTTVSVD